MTTHGCDYGCGRRSDSCPIPGCNGHFCESVSSEVCFFNHHRLPCSCSKKRGNRHPYTVASLKHTISQFCWVWVNPEDTPACRDKDLNKPMTWEEYITLPPYTSTRDGYRYNLGPKPEKKKVADVEIPPSYEEAIAFGVEEAPQPPSYGEAIAFGWRKHHRYRHPLIRTGGGS